MRYCGKIGYAWTEEKLDADGDGTGVFINMFDERTYYGDVTKLSSRVEGTNYLNDNINLTNQFSILADPFALDNFSNMKYIEYLGVKWKIVTVEVQRPRLILSIGGVYNGE